MIISAAIQTSSTAFAALIWWIVPLFVVLGAIGYVVWVAKFQDKFDNETNRSVAKFNEFQKSFNQPSAVHVVDPAGAQVEDASPTGSTSHAGSNSPMSDQPHSISTPIEFTS